MTVERSAVSTLNYLFLQTMIGNIDNQNVYEEVSTFIYDLSNELDTLKPAYREEFKRELNEGPYFHKLSKQEARKLMTEHILTLTNDTETYPAIIDFYLGLYNWNGTGTKKAVLVDFAIRTRIILDIDDNDIDILDDQYANQIAIAARDQIRQHVKDDPMYPYIDNVVETEIDDEVPYDPEYDGDTNSVKIKL